MVVLNGGTNGEFMIDFDLPGHRMLLCYENMQQNASNHLGQMLLTMSPLVLSRLFTPARYKQCVEPFARWIVCGKKSEQCHAAEVVQQLSAILTFKRLLQFDLNVPEFHEVTVFVGGIQLLTNTMLGSI